MKKWNTPELVTLDLDQTAYAIAGQYKDGGYTGDHIVSGHHTPDKEDEKDPCKPVS